MSSPQASFVGFCWFVFCFGFVFVLFFCFWFFFLYLNFCSAHRDKQKGGVEAELMGRVDVWDVGAHWLETQDSKQKQAEKDLYITMLLCKKTFTLTYSFHQGLHELTNPDLSPNYYLCMCVYVWYMCGMCFYMHSYMNVCVHACLCMPVEASVWHSMFSLVGDHITFETNSLSEPGFTDMSRLSWLICVNPSQIQQPHSTGFIGCWREILPEALMLL